jgi:tetratricopeptide (TPR) repeat protein
MSSWLIWSLLSIVTGNPLLAAGLVLVLWFFGDQATFRLLPDMGGWFARRGRADRLRRTLEMNPHDRRSRLALAEFLLETGRPAGALPLLRANLEAGDRDIFTMAALGTALAMTGAHEEAERVIAEASAIDPAFRVDQLDLVLGRMRLAQGDAAGAREPLTRLLGARPGTVEGRYYLARVLEQVGDRAGADRLRDEAWREYAQQPRFRRREDRRWAWRIRPWRPALVAVALLLALLLVGRAIFGSDSTTEPKVRAQESSSSLEFPLKTSFRQYSMVR